MVELAPFVIVRPKGCHLSVTRESSHGSLEAPESVTAASFLDAIRFNEDGLVPAIAQDADSGRVLMVAWMNAEAVRQTVDSGQAVYFSRSRQKLWHKGEESGHHQIVRDIRLDCDGDVLLLAVEQLGGIACHTGREHCFYRRLDKDGVWQTVEGVRRSPEEIYGQPSPADNEGDDA